MVGRSKQLVQSNQEIRDGKINLDRPEKCCIIIGKNYNIHIFKYLASSLFQLPRKPYNFNN